MDKRSLLYFAYRQALAVHSKLDPCALCGRGVVPHYPRNPRTARAWTDQKRKAGAQTAGREFVDPLEGFLEVGKGNHAGLSAAFLERQG